MNVRQCIAQGGSILAVCLLVAACGKPGNGPGTGSFDSAAPEVKTLWDRASGADKANEYLNAATNYNQLVAMESQLTPKQFDAVVAMSRAFTQRMVDAANNGDDSAKQALKSLMTQRRR